MRLGVNIDHVATLRQQRAGLVNYPNLQEAAQMVVAAGADQVTLHLRQDRRHIQDDDLIKLTKNRPAPVNLEMAAIPEMTEIAIKTKPEIVCLVPEKREELTTEGGLDVVRYKDEISRCIEKLKKNKIRVSLFVEADLEQIKMSKSVGGDAIEIHTGQYALAKAGEVSKYIDIISASSRFGHELGLAVHGGHGLHYQNTKPLLKIPYLEELNIGHSIICRGVMVGLSQAVKEMRDLMRNP